MKDMEAKLRAFTHRAPFRPFVVELVSGTRVTVKHSEALAMQAGTAVYVDEHGIPYVFDESEVAHIRATANGHRR